MFSLDLFDLVALNVEQVMSIFFALFFFIFLILNQSAAVLWIWMPLVSLTFCWQYFVCRRLSCHDHEEVTLFFSPPCCANSAQPKPPPTIDLRGWGEQIECHFYLMKTRSNSTHYCVDKWLWPLICAIKRFFKLEKAWKSLIHDYRSRQIVLVWSTTIKIFETSRYF